MAVGRCCLEEVNYDLPIVSSVVPVLGLPFRILNINLVNPKKRNYNGDYRYAATSEPRTKEYFENTCGPKLIARLDKSDSLYVVYKETLIAIPHSTLVHPGKS